MRSCGCGLMMAGSQSPFYFLPTSAQMPIHDPNSGIFLRKPMFSPMSRVGSSRLKATINEDLVSEASEMSFYELLGIPESGTLPEIKQAYKQLARKYHPDVSPPDRVDEYTQRFIMVQEAYETLSDPRRRALYDRDMLRGLHWALSSRRRNQKDEGLEGRGEWKVRWQSQLSELKRRGTKKDASRNMSWAAQMRRQREQSSNESY